MSAPPLPAAVILGTRGSALARAQAALVVDLLTEAQPGLVCETKVIATAGDRSQASGEPLPEIGGKGLFTTELERGLVEGEIDLAVHSLKDLPTEDARGVTIGAVCAREDVRDCVVSRGGRPLEELPAGSVVGTSSLRRIAQLRRRWPHLEARSIRGNVDTRIRKVRDGEVDAVVLASAGVLRLGLDDEVAEWLPVDCMLPAPGQGALAVQCRADDPVLELLAAIDDAGARATTTSERVFLRELGAGCTAPVAAYAEPTSPSDTVSQGVARVRLRGIVASRDGADWVEVSGEGEPEAVGAHVAALALESGAGRILAAIRG